MLRIIFAVSWNQHWRKNRALHSLVVVGIDADLLLLGTKRKLTAFQWLQFVVALEVGPAPHPAVDDMGQPLPVGDLQPAVQGAGDGDTATRLSRAAQGLLQLLHGALLLLQFFHQGIHSFLCPFFFLVALFPPEKSLHGGTREGEQTGHVHSDHTGRPLLGARGSRESPNRRDSSSDVSLFT